MRKVGPSSAAMPRSRGTRGGRWRAVGGALVACSRCRAMGGGRRLPRLDHAPTQATPGRGGGGRRGGAGRTGWLVRPLAAAGQSTGRGLGLDRAGELAATLRRRAARAGTGRERGHEPVGSRANDGVRLPRGNPAAVQSTSGAGPPGRAAGGHPRPVGSQESPATWEKPVPALIPRMMGHRVTK